VPALAPSQGGCCKALWAKGLGRGVVYMKAGPEAPCWHPYAHVLSKVNTTTQHVDLHGHGRTREGCCQWRNCDTGYGRCVMMGPIAWERKS